MSFTREIGVNVLSIKYNNDLPYDKFEKIGVEHLTDTELLAIVLKNGTKEKNVIELAGDIMQLAEEDNNIIGLTRLDYDSLIRVNGIGRVKAMTICCIVEMAKRIAMQTRKQKVNCLSPVTVAEYFMEQLRHMEIEQVIGVFTDIKGKMLKTQVLSAGSINLAVISPREIFRCALNCKAYGVIILHNHPSGDPTPSKEDLRITNKIIEAGMLMDIPLLDHIIVGDNRFISMKMDGYI